MPYSITYFNKILILAIAPFLFMSVGVLCKFDIVPDVPSGRRGALFFLRAQANTFSSTSIKKIQIFFSHYITMARLLLNWKKHEQEIKLCYGAYI